MVVNVRKSLYKLYVYAHLYSGYAYIFTYLNTTQVKPLFWGGIGFGGAVDGALSCHAIMTSTYLIYPYIYL